MKSALIPTLFAALSLVTFSGPALGKAAPQGDDPVPELKSVSGHPMQYYVVRPDGWTRDRTWPIVVAVEAAEKEFKTNAERFARARGKQPFVIVTPITVTNGNQGQRDPAVYPYSSATWDRIDKEGVCAFDEDGLARVIKEVREAYHGEDLIYLTGFEAGAHLVWATIFHHPEWLAAAAPVAGNYRGRCVDGNPFSEAPSRATLPVRGFASAGDKSFGPGSALFSQWKDAQKLAQAHGYTNVTETVIAGKDHVPLPEETLAYFTSLRKAASR
jgi:poly(3-hydroxybutyrate) depolymerase